MSRSVMLPLGLFVIGASIAGAQPAPSQSALEEGQPLVRVHRPREVGGGNQTWSFVQDARGVIYAGTNGAVLEFDGATWRRIALDNVGSARSLAIDASGRIFVGSASDFGYLAPDAHGTLHFVSLKDKLPELRWLIYDDPRGMNAYNEPYLLSFEEVECKGRELEREGKFDLMQVIDAGAGDDLAMIAYTSGTTGNPKGAMLSHANMIGISERFAALERVRPGDNWLAYLPMAWVGDAAFSLGLSLVSGAVGNCPEGPETVQRDLRELGPSALLAPPRIWENMLTGMQVKAGDATPLKRRVYEYFRLRAEQRQILEADNKPVPAGLKFASALGEFLVYGPVRDQLGLRNARICYTGGAPLGPDTYRFFRSFGVNLKQVYGATEATALVACQPDAEARPDTVGRALPGVEARIGDGGEVHFS